MPSIIKSKGESNFEPIPAGTYPAICTTVVNLGLQATGKWGPKPTHWIAFEVPSVRIEWEKDGQKHEGPAIVGSRYTSSLSPKANLRKQLESWRGRAFTEEELAGFDLFNILNAPCLLSIVHNESGGNTYANIAAIMGMPAGTPLPEAEGKLLKYDPSDPGMFDELPDWMKKAIEQGRQHEKVAPPPQQSMAPDFDDDIPF